MVMKTIFLFLTSRIQIFALNVKQNKAQNIKRRCVDGCVDNCAATTAEIQVQQISTHVSSFILLLHLIFESYYEQKKDNASNRNCSSMTFIDEGLQKQNVSEGCCDAYIINWQEIANVKYLIGKRLSE